MYQTPTKNVTMTPKKKIDYKYDLPAEYITFNQGLLDDEKWTNRDLQKLALKLQLPHTGTRDEIINNLLNWHRRSFQNGRRCGSSNFMLLEVELPPSPKDKTRKNTTTSSYLSPIKSKPRKNADGTPISILSTKKEKKEKTPKKSLNFSIFNSTKLVPPREAIYHSWLRQDGVENPEDWLEYDSEDEGITSIANEIASAAQEMSVSSNAVHNTPKNAAISQTQDDWLRSDASLPVDSPYIKKMQARSNPNATRQPRFEDSDDEASDDENTIVVRSSGVARTPIRNAPTPIKPVFSKNAEAPRTKTLGTPKTQDQRYLEEMNSGIRGFAM